MIQEHKARSLVEKKTVLNLLEAYASVSLSASFNLIADIRTSVSLKHYLRGEEGILYEDLVCLILHGWDMC